MPLLHRPLAGRQEGMMPKRRIDWNTRVARRRVGTLVVTLSVLCMPIVVGMSKVWRIASAYQP